MSDVEEHIKKQLEELEGKKLFVACSGGLDSTCLVHVLFAFGLDITCVHVNYKLRGEDSEKDAAFLNGLCNELSIPFLSKTIDLKKALDKGGNLQQLARDFRYDWFDQISNSSENSLIALAHHKDDQIETFLLNLSRKSGVMGLASMPYKREQIIRPFLDIPKLELEKYARKNKLKWRVDKSNSSNKYKRNFLRNEVIPFLKKEMDSIEESIVVLIAHFQSKQNELEQFILPYIEELNRTNTLSKEAYLSFDGFERVEFFRQLGQPSTKALEMTRLTSSQKGKKLELIRNERNQWLSVIYEGSQFTFEPLNGNKRTFELVRESVKELPTTFNKKELYLDTARIKGKLKLRAWEIGDRIQPVGMEGSKLISDIIADAKVSALEKKKVLVLHDDNLILWCIGYTVGRNAIADRNSAQIIKCSVTYSTLPE